MERIVVYSTAIYWPLNIDPEGATCNPYEWTYTVVLATGELSWTSCDRREQMGGADTDFIADTDDGDTGLSGSDFEAVEGKMTLSAAELGTVNTAFAAIHVALPTECEWDSFPDAWLKLGLRVESSEGRKDYRDDTFLGLDDAEHWVDGEALWGLEYALDEIVYGPFAW